MHSPSAEVKDSVRTSLRWWIIFSIQTQSVCAVLELPTFGNVAFISSSTLRGPQLDRLLPPWCLLDLLPFVEISYLITSYIYDMNIIELLVPYSQIAVRNLTCLCFSSSLYLSFVLGGTGIL